MSNPCISEPTVPSGATLITSQPYTHGTKAVFQCTTGYAMSGDPYVTCNNNAFTGTGPTCNLQDTNQVTVNLTDTHDDIPDWLFYLIAALVALIMFLILTCLLVWCCQLLGFYGGGGGMFGSPSSASGCWCCRRGHDDDGDYKRLKHQCRNFPRRYLYDENGRRFHFDDVGRACYYNHKHQNGKVVVAPADESSIITVESHDKKVAKELATWKPHSNPVRHNNTSTK